MEHVQAYTIYFIMFLIAGGLALTVYSMNRYFKVLEKRINSVKSQLRLLMIRSGHRSSKELRGELDIKHPKTGENMKAQARFKISDE